MKKLLSFCLIIIFLFSLSGCKTDNFEKKLDNKKDNKTTEITENVTGEKTTEGLKVSLVSVQTGKFAEMNFVDYKKSSISPLDDATALVLLLYSDDDNIPLSQVEKATVRSSDNKVVNISTRMYMLNNKKGCVIFAKTEGIHKPEEYGIFVSTYDGAEKFIAVPKNGETNVAEGLSTETDKAKYGDIVKIKNNLYFVLQNGSLSSTTYNSEGTDYSEVIVGMVFVPLTESYKSKFTDNEFTSSFEDTEHLGDYGVKTEIKVNDKMLKDSYADNYKGLYVDFITCSFKIKITSSEKEQITKQRDYVMNNTYLKNNSDKNFNFKIYAS